MEVQVQVSWAGFTSSSEVDGKIYNFSGIMAFAWLAYTTHPRDFGACKGEGECAGELSTHVQISWGLFPSSLLLSPPLEMEREGNVCALQRFYQYVWTEAPYGGMAPPYSPGTALSAVEPRGSSDIHSMGP